MEKCAECGGKVQRATEIETITIDGRKLTADLPGWKCETCGVHLDGEPGHRFDLAVAATLARDGASSGEALRHMRKALGMPFGEPAGLLGVAPDTLVRWERDEREAPRTAAATIGSLVIDACLGSHAFADRLRALGGERPKPAEVVRVEVPMAAKA